MRLVHSLVLGLLVLPVLAAQQPSAADPNLLAEVTAAGAHAEALAVFCTTQNRSALQTNATALAQWRGRNRWSVVRAFWPGTPSLEAAFNTERASTLAELKQHAFKSAFTCGVLPNVLRSEKFDPSVRRSAALVQLAPPSSIPATPAPEASGNSRPATSPQDGTSSTGTDAVVGANAAAVQGPAAPGIHAPAASAPGDNPVPIPGNRQLTAGEATFTLPPGWQVAKSTPDLAMLQFDKPHDGRTLLLITASPLTGDLRQSFLASVRSQFPGTGLTLKYPHEALTPTGLHAITVGDSGHLNNPHHTSAAVTAVGIATAGRLQTAFMLSTTSIGEQIDRKKDLERLVSTWQLRTPGPQPAWNPLHPPPPAPRSPASGSAAA